MPPESPRSDEPDIVGGGAASPAAGNPTPRHRRIPTRTEMDPRDADVASRAYWEATADSYQAEHGAFLADQHDAAVDPAHPAGRTDDHVQGSAGAGFVWGPEGRTESELQVLANPEELARQRILEVGCGAAQCSAWLAAHGVRAVGVDIALAQLRHARRADPPPTGAAAPDPGPSLAGGRGGGVPKSREHGSLGLVAGTATALPFADDSFDLAFSSYGAVQFVADLDVLLAEVARVLRPGGRWCFSVTHPIRWAFPDDPGQMGLGVSGSYFDRTPYVERDQGGRPSYAEFHRTLGDYVTALARAGFVVDTLLEPEWPEWNHRTWGGWSPLRGWYLPGTLILGSRRIR